MRDVTRLNPETTDQVNNMAEANRPAPVPQKSKSSHTGTHCMAPGCTNWYYKCPWKSFHTLPTDTKLRKQWLQAMKLANPPLRSRLCSDHFLETDFATKGSFGNDGRFVFEKTNKLKATAVPSVFDFSGYDAGETDRPSTSSASKRELSAQRETRRKRRQVQKQVKEVTDSIAESPGSGKLEENSEVPGCSGTKLQDVLARKEVGIQVCADTRDSTTQTNETDFPGSRFVSVGMVTEEIGMALDVSRDHGYAAYHKGATFDRELTTKSNSVCEPSFIPGELVDSPGATDVTEEHMEWEDPTSEYVPSDSEETDDASSSDDTNFTDFTEPSEPKYIVFLSQLMQLFVTCLRPWCKQPLVSKPSVQTEGFALKVGMECLAGHDCVWHSQPKIKDLYAGNILIPAAMFLAGQSYSVFKEMCDSLSLVCLSVRHCYNIQKAFVVPQVNQMWTTHIEALMSAMSSEAVVACGDARCDSPGHCATFGTYTVLDTATNIIIAQETVKVTEVKNSYWMEPEGLDRCLETLRDHDVTIKTLATDRHPSVRKMLATNFPFIAHEYDLWHIVKSFKKRMLSTKSHDLLPWVRAAANHLWYCAATCEGNAQMLREMWTSFLNHITNRHEWLSGELFHRCAHEPYSEADMKRRPWLKESSASFSQLQKLVLDPNLLADLSRVTQCVHTSCLESIHSLYLKYAPKRTKFSLEGMEARLRLAALEHNLNVQRDLARTARGDVRYKLQFSKAAGQYVVKNLKAGKNWAFRSELLFGIAHRCRTGPSLRQLLADVERTDSETLAQHAGVAKPDKTEIVSRHVTRYKAQKK